MENEEFGEIVRQHQERVFRMLMRLVGDRDRVEDLAQEVFLRLFRALPHFRGEARLTTYLYRIISNVAKDEWARRKRDQSRTSCLSRGEEDSEDPLEQIPDTTPSMEERVLRHQMATLMQASLTKLNPEECQAIVLYHQEDCSYEEISRIMDLPIGTVRTHLHRGRQKLHSTIQKRMKIQETK